nr:glycosyltransferase [Ameyamaea chiangmaiensis]
MPSATHAKTSGTITPRPPRRSPTRAPIAVVVPVHGQRAVTLACLDAVCAAPTIARIIVVEDGRIDAALSKALDARERSGAITLLRHDRARGFPAAANAGLRAAAGCDVVLLNSDTLVPPGWLERLADIAYASPATGSVTPLSNDATILSYPDREGGNPVPDLAETVALDQLAQEACAASGHRAVPIPTAVGFCTFLRHDCLAQTGLLRGDLFAQGYGEENDLCMRAAALGWHHVAAPGVFVAHVGSASFGANRAALLERNLKILHLLHPDYDLLVQAHIQDDPLAPARRALDLARWRATRDRPRDGQCVLAITHAAGGGVEQVRRDRAAAHRRAGRRTLTLRPHSDGCRVETDDLTIRFPNLTFALPHEMPDLLTFLRDEGVGLVEWHHLLGHHPVIRSLPERLAVPYDVFVHDYVWFCPRITLVGIGERYCGEPDLDGCRRCVRAQGSLLDERLGIDALRTRSAAELGAARRVLVPSHDTARRIERHFPGLICQVEAPEDDRPALPLAVLAALAPTPSHRRPRRPGVMRVCVAGAIGRDKGFTRLLDMARHARTAALPLEFAIVGHTIDDDLLMQTGHAFVTGEYVRDEAEALIRAQDADIGFLPSIWPETWCLALSSLWRAGLPVAVFDFGAPAERVARTGRGWRLSPALTPETLCTHLLQCRDNSLPFSTLR